MFLLPGGCPVTCLDVDPRAEELLWLWFGQISVEGLCEERVTRRWFRAGPAFDRECAEAFGEVVEEALGGGLESWNSAPRSCLALILLLDQLPRNIHRGTARAFAGDARALATAGALVDGGSHLELRPVERYFAYLPFEHAEDLAVQDRAVALMGALAASPPPGGEALFAGGLEWAERHRVAIRRLGRFPARNGALGRESTADEIAFLAEHPIGF